MYHLGRTPPKVAVPHEDEGAMDGANEAAPKLRPPRKKLAFWERFTGDYRGGDVRARHRSRSSNDGAEGSVEGASGSGRGGAGSGPPSSAGAGSHNNHRRNISTSSVSSLASDPDDFVEEDLCSPGTRDNRGITFRYSLSSMPTAVQELQAVDPEQQAELVRSKAHQLKSRQSAASASGIAAGQAPGLGTGAPASPEPRFDPGAAGPSSPTARASIGSLGSGLSQALSGLARAFSGEQITTVLSSTSDQAIPPLAICILVTGTRGDVQPFIALGLGLTAAGHRVRLATHAPYRDFVEGFGLEFYPLGGDPKVLSEYVVKNRGIFTNSVAEVMAQRKQLKAIIQSTYPACTQPDPEHPDVPFTAEAIIANPVCYGHTHCAEKLGVPLHMFFTMPWTPTAAFPHPMARIMYDYHIADRIVNLSKQCVYFASNAESLAAITQNGEIRQDAGWGVKFAHWMFGFQRNGQEWIIRQMELANRLSYAAIDDLLFPGVADLLDAFRTKTLKLPSLYTQPEYVHSLYGRNVPFSYCWSEALVSKPEDWGENIDVVGFFFLDVAHLTEYEPPKDLLNFLEAGPPPVYIGFGSLVVDHPQWLTKKIYKALKETGQRAIISKGWGNLGSIPGHPIPDNVLLVDNVPHDWLFLHCSAVVHHGGAGTTAAGLLAGCPTTIVPFFGDQPFWGEAVRRAGAGPRPIPIDSFSRKKLVAALDFMQREDVRERARHIRDLIKLEDGVASGVDSFHRHLPLEFLLEKRRQRWSAGWGPVSNGLASPASPLSPAQSRLIVRGRHPPTSRTGAWLSKDSWRDWWRQKRQTGGGASGGPGVSRASAQASGHAGHAHLASPAASQELGRQGRPGLASILQGDDLGHLLASVHGNSPDDPDLPLAAESMSPTAKAAGHQQADMSVISPFAEGRVLGDGVADNASPTATGGGHPQPVMTVISPYAAGRVPEDAAAGSVPHVSVAASPPPPPHELMPVISPFAECSDRNGASAMAGNSVLPTAIAGPADQLTPATSPFADGPESGSAPSSSDRSAAAVMPLDGEYARDQNGANSPNDVRAGPGKPAPVGDEGRLPDACDRPERPPPGRALSHYVTAKGEIADWGRGAQHAKASDGESGTTGAASASEVRPGFGGTPIIAPAPAPTETPGHGVKDGARLPQEGTPLAGVRSRVGEGVRGQGPGQTSSWGPGWGRPPRSPFSSEGEEAVPATPNGACVRDADAQGEGLGVGVVGGGPGEGGGRTDLEMRVAGEKGRT